MKKFKVTRTYGIKTFTESLIVEAKTPEAASKAAEEELDAKEDEIEENLTCSELFQQEEVEEVD
jgi:hypothetical protein